MKIQGSWAAAAALLSLLVVAGPGDAYVTSYPEEPDIDGTLLTVGLTVGHWLAGALPYPGFSALLDALLYAWTPKPEDDYWEHIEQQVHDLCGNFVNQDNIDKVLVYKNDLMTMLRIYENSPVEGDGSYPTKNVQADAITSSIISNRYLVEASLMPWSMTLYFVDIASMHIIVLQDAAESYTFPDTAPSLWWRDLSTELAHYITYSRTLYDQTLQFRRDNIECYFDEGGSTDKYIITDHVTGLQDSCTQIHPGDGEVGSCASACQNFEDQVVRDLAAWYWDFVGYPASQWEQLRFKAELLAENASGYRVPPHEE
ncbi:uncharacterized protein LOC108677420 [Hyalella azteca]|uniref:Uncharacterized protein LOC108677420 n=1 Tax=Hyalella azteca TaxID=294128 RepID=A0A8B7P501_HYAAZ|nr:uncharacterized protein LOC108677420 [Hyalella azteca]XP_047738121.1 uncharacterized protein LOC108677420 [Hyalella azteca]